MHDTVESAPAEVANDPVIQPLLLQMRDTNPHLYRHSVRVTMMSLELSQRIRLRGFWLRITAKAAFLHDVGKLGLDDCSAKRPLLVLHNEAKILNETLTFGIRQPFKMLLFALVKRVIARYRTYQKGSSSRTPEGDLGVGYAPTRRRRVSSAAFAAQVVAVCDLIDSAKWGPPGAEPPAWHEIHAKVRYLFSGDEILRNIALKTFVGT